uniref:Uncharacterized protein n=1 Tax=Lepeophtheirus salmonis TaxID=72036 RepID=A0A0K2TR42_LEPSM
MDSARKTTIIRSSCRNEAKKKAKSINLIKLEEGDISLKQNYRASK